MDISLKHLLAELLVMYMHGSVEVRGATVPQKYLVFQKLYHSSEIDNIAVKKYKKITTVHFDDRLSSLDEQKSVHDDIGRECSENNYPVPSGEIIKTSLVIEESMNFLKSQHELNVSFSLNGCNNENDNEPRNGKDAIVISGEI
ncbi:unnamed protein product [Spodoptera exigua]|nr:unnamed protein product [Spodoptera exigua]